MKRALVVSILLIGCVGCGTRAASAPVPGQLNTFDAYAFRVLADAQAAINAFKADVSTGKVPSTPTLKTILNQAITDYNIAETSYRAWHAAGGTGNTSPITAGITQVQLDITNIATQAGSK